MAYYRRSARKQAMSSFFHNFVTILPMNPTLVRLQKSAGKGTFVIFPNNRPFALLTTVVHLMTEVRGDALALHHVCLPRIRPFLGVRVYENIIAE